MLNKVTERFNIQVASIHEVDDSHSSTVYKCTLQNGENVFVKIPFTHMKYQREREAYHILEGELAIPSLLDAWDGDDHIPGAFLLSELKGQPLSLTASNAIAYEVGVLHASMHSIQPDSELISIKNEYSNWSNLVEQQFVSFAVDVKKILEEELYHQAIEKFYEMKNELPPPDGPSFIHMDFRPGNIIVEEHQVSGVIDFESIRFGSTEMDFTKIHRDFLRFDERLYQAFKDGYKSVRPLIELEAVLPFYRFTDAFNSIGWCKRRGIDKNKLFFEENVARLKEFLSV